jgi:hypothetical protein
MTIRTIVNDIRTHAADFLKERRLAPIVKFADEGARNDIISFQAKSGREHIVSVIVPREAGEDAWNRAAIAPLNVRAEPMPDTAWSFVQADGVRFEDIRGFGDLGTVEERVARLVEHLEMRDGRYAPRDDLSMQICTDSRIPRVVNILRNVAEHAADPFVIKITGDENDDEALVDTVVLQMDDGRTIDVVLRQPTIEIGITDSFSRRSRDITVPDLWVFETAMVEVGKGMAEKRRRTDLSY